MDSIGSSVYFEHHLFVSSIIKPKLHLGSNFKDDKQIFSVGLSGGNYKDTPIKIQYYSSKRLIF